MAKPQMFQFGDIVETQLSFVVVLLKGKCNISSTHEHLCLFTKALWPYRNYYLIIFLSFTHITTPASL